ncbi:MAG: hypothetical protein HGA78_07510 [Nitrospirales bacterium]|nr:hypothetical protein [Nitrospirales bacterium]
MNKLNTVSRVLEIKDRKKEEIESEVMRLRDRLRRLEESLECLELRFGETTREFEKKQLSNEMDLHSLDLFYAYFMKLSEDITARKKEISRQISELHERQSALIEAYKEKRLFEIIRERIEKNELSIMEKADQKEQDFQYLVRRVRGI